MSADTTKISRLLDEMAIRDLGARYADAVTRGDYGAFRSCWAEDAEWVIGGTENQPYERRAHGVDEIVELYRSLWEEKQFFIQFVVQGPIKVHGDEASARCLSHESARGPGDAGYRTDGVWFDELHRAGDEWVFIRRTYQYVWLDTSPFTGDGYPAVTR